MATSSETVPHLQTPLCSLLGIKYPILLAGMARTSGGPLAAAVSNAGGLGCIGGLGYTPEQLQEIITDLKSHLSSPTLPFAVDLALPQVGGSARKTNHDYTNGQLDELIEVTIKNGARLFVSAVGVPPEKTVKRLHEAGILIMNMVGHPKHAEKALNRGVDIICAQGTEGGGHTGTLPTSILIPSIVALARTYTSPLTHSTPLIVAAGGISTGSSVASALMLGASGVWVGTRFVASVEAGCSTLHKQAVLDAGYDDTLRTLVVTGRPLRCKRNAYIDRWEGGREKREEMERLVSEGTVPMEHDLKDDKTWSDVEFPFLMGMVAGGIAEVKPAKQIVDEMVAEAVQMLKLGHAYLRTGGSKL